MGTEPSADTPKAPPGPLLGRRHWLLLGLAAVGAAAIVWFRRRRPRATRAPATTLEAVLERLLPAEAGMPSAIEANVAAYVEAELAKPQFAGPARAIKSALERLDEAAAARGAARFMDLGEEAQDALLVAFTEGKLPKRAKNDLAVFQVLFALALEGYFGAPHHGGNAGAVAWQAIGFDATCQTANHVPVMLP